MSDDQAMRDFTRKLFGRRETETDETEAPSNVVPGEGRHVPQSGDDDHAMREFTGALFGRSSTIHEIH